MSNCLPAGLHRRRAAWLGMLPLRANSLGYEKITKGPETSCAPGDTVSVGRDSLAPPTCGGMVGQSPKRPSGYGGSCPPARTPTARLATGGSTTRPRAQNLSDPLMGVLAVESFRPKVCPNCPGIKRVNGGGACDAGPWTWAESTQLPAHRALSLAPHPRLLPASARIPCP